jgi:hypothetical protein
MLDEFRITDPPRFQFRNRVGYNTIPERFVAHVPLNLAVFGQADAFPNKIHVVPSGMGL